MAVKSIEIDNLINGQLYGFRMFPRNLKGQYQTRDDRGTATATPVAFSLPTYTGNHAIFGDINEGRIEMYTSGTLTLSSAIYDVFIVGGGGSGGGNSNYAGNGGGGGGYVQTYLSKPLSSSTNVIIGSGSDGDGGNTKLTSSLFELIALGGKKGESASSVGGAGGDGGSGGGSGDGNSRGKSGIGQHTTTRAFGESDGALYAGGGGSGGYKGYNGGSDGNDGNDVYGGLGGSGGGGNGRTNQNDVTAQSGTPNTGGGGGGDFSSRNGGYGGSGIAIVRWKRN